MTDAPEYRWRGVLLDVGRHFFEVPFILKVLDICALYKLNKFHWHLTEDQVRASFVAFSQETGRSGSWLGGRAGVCGFVCPVEAAQSSPELCKVPRHPTEDLVGSSSVGLWGFVEVSELIR